MKNRTILVSFLFCLLSAIPAAAMNFRILYVSSPKAVSIDGVTGQVGTVFADNAVLSWSDDKQVIKVEELESGKQFIICARSVEGKGSFSLADYFFLMKNLASRTGRYDSFSEMASFFTGMIEIDGSLSIPTGIPQDNDRFFYLACRFPDGDINKAITPGDGALLLSIEEIFKVDGNPIDPYITEAALYYYDRQAETSTCISPSFFIVPVPSIRNHTQD